MQFLSKHSTLFIRHPCSPYISDRCTQSHTHLPEKNLSYHSSEHQRSKNAWNMVCIWLGWYDSTTSSTRALPLYFPHMIQNIKDLHIQLQRIKWLGKESESSFLIPVLLFDYNDRFSSCGSSSLLEFPLLPSFLLFRSPLDWVWPQMGLQSLERGRIPLLTAIYVRKKLFLDVYCLSKRCVCDYLGGQELQRRSHGTSSRFSCVSTSGLEPGILNGWPTSYFIRSEYYHYIISTSTLSSRRRL